MIRLPKLWNAFHVIWTSLSLMASCFGATSHQIAQARVTVSLALIQIADESASLANEAPGSVPDPQPESASPNAGTSREDKSPHAETTEAGAGDAFVKTGWSVMACNAEGCALWKAEEIKSELPTKYLVCKPPVDHERASTATITIVHGEERWSGKFAWDDEFSTVFESTKPVEEVKHVDAAEAVSKALAEVKERTPNPFESSSPVEPMKLEYIQPVDAAFNGSGPVHCVVVVADWCKPCHTMQHGNGAGDSRVSFEYVDEKDATSYGLEKDLVTINLRPVTFWQDATGKSRFTVGPQTTNSMYAVIQRNGGGLVQKASYGAAGAFRLKGSAPIRQGFEVFDKYIGQGVPVSFELDRSGDASISLMSKTPKTVRSILGATGHLALSMPGAKFQIKEFGFGWNLNTSKISLDEIYVPDLEHILDKKSFGSAGPQPSQFFLIDDVLFWGNLASCVQTLMSLFSPQLDAILPGELEAVATLNGEVLTIDWKKAPAIHFAEVVRGTLTLQKMTVSPTQIEVWCTGPWWVPRWIKHRTIAVE